MDEQHPSPLQRFDEPPPRPAMQDVLEAIVDALDRATSPEAPALSTARCRSVQTRLHAALGQVRDDGGAQLIGSLERLERDWRQS